MAFEGYAEIPIKKMGSLVTSFASEALALGASPNLRNCRFTLNSVATRYGIQQTISTKKNKAVNSLGMLIRSGQNPSQIPLLFNSDGTLTKESSALDLLGLPLASGDGSFDISPTLLTWAGGSYLQMAATFQRMYMVNGNLKQGVGFGAVTDGTNTDPFTQLPVGSPWQANYVYLKGDCVIPTPVNGLLYRATNAGTSGAAQPAFPAGDSSTVVDNAGPNQITWQENTPVAANDLPLPPLVVNRVAGAGAFAAGRDVYIVITLTNGNGETAPGSVFSFLTGTVLNDRFVVTAPVIPAWVLALVAPNRPTLYNVYEADVAHNAAAPVLSAFKLVASTALGANTNVDTTGAGAAPPVASTAFITAAGNVAIGQRYLAVLFVNRFGNLSGFSLQSINPFTLVNAGRKLFVAKVPVGPSYVTQRIVLLSAALTASTPIFFIDVSQATGTNTSMVINDNVTTTVVLNFSDDALSAATNATNRTLLIKLQPQTDIQYLDSLKRLSTVGEVGQPSLGRFSKPNDPESFDGSSGYQYVARDNDQRLITYREFQNGIIVAMKERSGYTIGAGDNEPLQWPANRVWRGWGPAGPRAVDVGDDGEIGEFIVVGGRQGAYVWSGQSAIHVSKEIQSLWDQINWDFGHLLKCAVDNQNKEIHFFVPFGGATTNNLEFVLNFKRGFADPVHYSSFTGKEIAIPTARKWAINDIGASDALRAYRRYAVGPNIFPDEFLLASPVNDGLVHAITPESYNDNGAGINSYYATATGTPENQTGVMQLGGAIFKAKGMGMVTATAVPYHGPDVPLSQFKIALDDNTYYMAKAQAGGPKSRQWGAKLSNGAQADVWFELFEIDIYANVIWRTETSSATQ